MAGILLGRFQNAALKAGKTDFASRMFRFTADPPGRLLGAGLNGISDFSYGFVHSGSLMAENRNLKALAQAEGLYNLRLQVLNDEITQLKKLEGYPSFAPKKRIAAQVIGVFPDENRATVGAGTAEGVAPGDPVVSAEGLFGIIQTADSHSSQVTLMTSPLPFKIGAVVERTPPSAGLIHGESWDRLELDLSIDSPVQKGDVVITSGFSDKIPRGIPIGRVVQVIADKDFGTVKAQVVPNAHVGEVQEVFVIQ